jgi:predicted metal-dependent hydrolase
MTTETHHLMVSGVRVSVVRKEIKNLHLGVYPPDGRVRVAAPLAVSDAAVRVAVIGKLGWIRRQRAAFESQERQSQREVVSGESHYFLGRRYRLAVVTTQGKSGVVLRNRTIMELQVRPDLTADQRERVLQRWYREALLLQQQMTSRPKVLCLLAGRGATSSRACLLQRTRRKAEVLL